MGSFYNRILSSALASVVATASLCAQAGPQDPDSPEAQLQKLNQDISSRLMKLRLAEAPAPKLSIASRKTGGLSVRFMAPWRQGVFVTEEVWTPEKPNMPVLLRPHWLDLKDLSLHPLRVKGVDQILDAIVAGGEAYAVVQMRKEIWLARLDSSEAIKIPTPVKLEAARLGLHGERLVLLNGPHVWRLEGESWKPLPGFNDHWRKQKAADFFSEMEPGFPPEHVLGRLVYWQAGNERNYASLPNAEGKQAWSDWFDGIGVHQDLERMLGSHWAIVPAGNGAVWMSRGDELGEHLIRLTPGKTCEVAFLFGDPAFVMPMDGLPKERIPKVTAGALKVRDDGSLLMFGRTGVFELVQREIKPLLHLENTVQTLDLPAAKGKLIWRWDPGRVLEVEQDKVLVGGTWGGLYLFASNAQGQWTITCLDDGTATPLEFNLSNPRQESK